MMDEDGAMGCPLVDSHFQLQQAPTRDVMRNEYLSSNAGVRFWPRASGEIANYTELAPETYPAVMPKAKSASSDEERGSIVGLFLHGVSK